MEIVIDIDDIAYKFAKNTSFVEDESTLFKQLNVDREKTLFLFDILDAIKNGTLLPEGVEILTKEAYSDLCTRAADVPDKNVGDLISRQAVIEWLKDKDIIKTKNQEENARRELAELPPVKPERKIGHWEYTQSDYDPNVGDWHCSECKDIVVTCLTRVAEGRIQRYKYCSNCGCRMVEPYESEDGK